MEATLTQLVKLRTPIEAVGLILPDDTVVELANRSDHPRDSFKLFGEDIIFVLQEYKFALTQETIEQTTLWHSHPSGGMGPSTTDLKQKAPGLSHLVLTLSGDEVVPTWY